MKIYTASKTWHAQRWEDLKHELRGSHRIVSRWMHFVLAEEENRCLIDPNYASIMWQIDLEDITRCDVVLVYVEPGEHLRGALVEAGMGIALGKTVIVVGEHPDYGSWQHHKRVLRADTLDEALVYLDAMDYSTVESL